MSKIPEIEIYITGKELKMVFELVELIKETEATGHNWESARVQVKGRPNYHHIPDIIKKLKEYHQLNKLKE